MAGKPNPLKTKMRTIAIPEAFYFKLKEMAEKSGRSISAEICTALAGPCGAKKRSVQRTITVEDWDFSQAEPERKLRSA